MSIPVPITAKELSSKLKGENEMNKAFIKGQKVTHILSWDNKGTVAYRQAIVYSCGKKQMVLTDAVTGEEMGRHFAPVLANAATVTGFNWCGTFDLMSDDQATEMCLELGKTIVEINRQRYTHLSQQTQYGKGYCDAMKKELDALHKPRVHRYHK